MTLNMELHWRAWRREENKPTLTGEAGAGLLVVLTGNGKGKSTAAYGMAWRAMARNIHVGVVQFIGQGEPGAEAQTLGKHAYGEFKAFGAGCSWQSQQRNENKAQAVAAWAEVKRMLADTKYGMVICDDILPLLHEQWLSLDTVQRELKQRRRNVHVILTGRHAPHEIMDQADLVTEMRQVKYPQMATPAQAGIEF